MSNCSWTLKIFVDYFQLQNALVRDVVTIISSGLKGNKLYEWIDEPPTTCINLGELDQTWQNGIELLKNIDVSEQILIFQSIYDIFFELMMNI